MGATSEHVRRAGASLLLATAIFAAGCGGSSSLSKADLVGKANAICASTTTQLKGLGAQPADFATNAASAAAYLDKVVPIVDKAVNDLAALKPPSEVSSDWSSLVSALKQEDQLYMSADHKAHAKDPSGLQDLSKLVDVRTNSTHPLEQKLGLTQCHG